MAAALVGLSIAGIVLHFARRRRCRGCTLMAAWWWGLASWAANGAVWSWWAAAGFPASPRLAAFRFIAAVGAFSPLMAVLGAKRPQDKPWQFIVLSLWVVLSLPAAQTLFVRGDRLPSFHGMFSFFLLALAAAGVWNGLGTRYFATALAIAGGQLFLLAPHIGLFTSDSPLFGIAGLGCFVVAGGHAVFVDRGPVPPASALDRAWLDFRDSYGVFWAMRVQDRMNAAGSAQNWSVELAWSGFRPAEEHGATQAEANSQDCKPPLVQTLINLLRRFVSPEWIAARLGPDLE